MSVSSETLFIGDWTLFLPEGRLQNKENTVDLEPKTLEVLLFLHRHQGQVVSQEALMNHVWSDSVVSLGAIARCISKLRKAFGDSSQTPRYIETLPKRGYRLLEPSKTPLKDPQEAAKFGKIPAFSLLAAIFALAVMAFEVVQQKPISLNQDSTHLLLRRADDFYYQYTRADNEAAMALYERVLAADPNSAAATFGLANTLAQTVIRWPETMGELPAEAPNLANALATQRTHSSRARLMLQRAEALALRAVRLDENHSKAHRSLGLVNALLQRFDEAHGSYDRAIELDSRAWGAMINKSELYTLENQHGKALEMLERAYSAMTAVYDREPVHIRPWYAEVGNAIGHRYETLGRKDDAEIWFRRVLEDSPLHVDATLGLAQLLQEAGDFQKADALRQNLTLRVGALPEPGDR